MAVDGYYAGMGLITLLHTWSPVAPAVGLLFTALDPVLIPDSRSATTVGAYDSAWGAGTQREVPADAEAVVLNVTVTDTSASSYLTE